MSKWFASAQDLSESESSDSSDEEKKTTTQQAQKAAPAKTTAGAASQARNKFIKNLALDLKGNTLSLKKRFVLLRPGKTRSGRHLTRSSVT